MEKSPISTYPEKISISLDIDDIQIAIFNLINEPDVLAKSCMVSRQTKQNVLKNLFLYPSKKKVEFTKFIITKWMNHPDTIDKDTKELLSLVRKNGFALKPELYIKAITLLIYNTMPSEKYEIVNLLYYAKKILSDEKVKAINICLKWINNPAEQMQYRFKSDYDFNHLKSSKIKEKIIAQNKTTDADDTKKKKSESPTTDIKKIIKTASYLLEKISINNKYKMLFSLRLLALKIQKNTTIENLKNSLLILEKIFLHSKNAYLEIYKLNNASTCGDLKNVTALYADTAKALLKISQNFPLEEYTQKYITFIDEILTMPPPDEIFDLSKKILKTIFKLTRNVNTDKDIEKCIDWCIKLLSKSTQSYYPSHDLKFFIKEISNISNQLIINYQHEQCIKLYSAYIDNLLSIAFEKNKPFLTKDIFKIILGMIAELALIVKRDKQQQFTEKYFNEIVKIANCEQHNIIPYDYLARTMLILWKIDNSYSNFIWNYFTTRQLTIKRATLLIILDQLFASFIDLTKKDNHLELEIIEKVVAHENLSLAINHKIHNRITTYLNPDFIFWITKSDLPLLDALYILSTSNVLILDFKCLYALAEKIKIKYPSIANSLICTANLLTVNHSRLNSSLQKNQIFNGNQWRHIDERQFNGYINLKGFDFSGLELLNMDLTNTDLSKANFKNTNCVNVIFHRSNLSESDFSGAKIKNVDFENCDNLASAKRTTLNNLKIKIQEATTLEELDNIIKENRKGILSIHQNKLSGFFEIKTSSVNEFNTIVIEKRKQLEQQANEQSLFLSNIFK